MHVICLCRIWNFLEDLVAQNPVTVIVTTHYIEETRQADKVGIMRHGRLLAEDCPSQLLFRFNVDLLDDLVLLLCQKDEFGEDVDDPLDYSVNSQRDHSPVSGLWFQSRPPKPGKGSTLGVVVEPSTTSHDDEDHKRIQTTGWNRLKAL